MDVGGIFSVILKKSFQDTLLMLVHAVERGNQKKIGYEGFYWYLNKVQKTNSVDKYSLQQFLKELFCTVCLECSPSIGTNITQSLVAIDRELPFKNDLSPSI